MRITKYTKAITIGAIITPNISPNLIQDLFNGDRNFEFIKPKIKKITEAVIK